METVSEKFDGALKFLIQLCLSLLEYCLAPTEDTLNAVNPMLLASPFFTSTTPSDKFETCLIVLCSISYLLVHRKDLTTEVEAFVVRHQSQLLQIQEVRLVIAISLFYSYYCEELFKRQDQKQHLEIFFNHFVALSSLAGAENRAIRIQTFNSLENMVSAPNFKAQFSSSICVVVDNIVGN